MKLLQAAMGAGLLIVYVIYPIFLVIGTMATINWLMRLVWRMRNKQEYIQQKMPYYKDPWWFILCLIISIAVVTSIFGCLIFCAAGLIEFD